MPGPVLAAPFHLQGAADAAPYGYGRDGNPTWTGVEPRSGGSRTPRRCCSPPGWPRSARCWSRRSARATCSSRCGTATRACAAWHATGSRRAASRCGSSPTDTDGDRRGVRGGDARVDRDAVEPRARRLRHRGGRRRRPRRGRAARGRQHARHAARPAAARPRRRRGHVQRDEGALRPLRPRARRGRACAIPSGPPRCASTARRAGRSRARSRPGCCTARSPRSRCGSAARARTRSRSRGWLRAHPDVRDVRHPGLEEPGPCARRAQMRLPGPLVGFTLDERGARAALPRRARAGGGGDELRRRALDRGAPRRAGGPTPSRTGFIRFSAGCEDAEDLLADVEQALAASG